MEINWFTVIAQVINFLILVWLLRRFLYKPVLNAIEEREKKIAAQLKDAADKKAEAQKERDAFQQKNETFDNELNSKMNKAREDVANEKHRLSEEARKEYEERRTKLEQSLIAEQQNIANTIKRKTQAEVFAIANKALTDLASSSLEQQLLKVFIYRIHNLKEEEKLHLKNAFSKEDTVIVVKCAFELPLFLQAELEKELLNTIDRTAQFRYAISPGLISGIEICAQNYRLSWNIDSYLNSLQQHISVSENIKEAAHVTD